MRITIKHAAAIGTLEANIELNAGEAKQWADTIGKIEGTPLELTVGAATDIGAMEAHVRNLTGAVYVIGGLLTFIMLAFLYLEYHVAWAS